MTPGPRARWPTGTPLVLVADGLPFSPVTNITSPCGPVATGDDNRLHASRNPKHLFYDPRKPDGTRPSRVAKV